MDLVYWILFLSTRYVDLAWPFRVSISNATDIANILLFHLTWYIRVTYYWNTECLTTVARSLMHLIVYVLYRSLMAETFGTTLSLESSQWLSLSVVCIEIGPLVVMHGISWTCGVVTIWHVQPIALPS